MTNLLKICSKLAKAIYFNEDQQLSVDTINQLNLVPAKAQRVVDQLSEKRDNIKDMAISMSGR